MTNTMINIAIADDSVYIRLGAATSLKKYENCDVMLEAQDGKELIDSLSSLERLPDICIIESNNEILNNYKTLIDLQHLFPTIKTLAVSRYELEYTKIKMIQHGVRGYLSKKDSINELHTAIENIHTTGYYYSEIAPMSLFEKARQETLPELTEQELQLLSLTADKFNSTDPHFAMFIQENMLGDSFHSIMKKLKLHDQVGLLTYMMQTGLIPHQHLISY